MSDVVHNQRGEWAISLVSGVIFGLGLALSGMTRPEKVRGFLDFTGAWDPSLAFVMGGAVLVHALAFRLITRRKSPVFAAKFALPTRRDLDAKLLGGAALFGVGWGLGGFCPGPGITSLVGGAAPVAFFVLAMLVGIAVTARFEDSAMPVVDAARTPTAR
jgi:uncharacterized membrane protein YedE/YeeE